MSDAMPMPQGQPAPAQGEPNPADVVESNRSWLNPTDAMVQLGRTTLTPETTLGEFLGNMGLDVNAPAIPQLQRFMEAQQGNQDPLSKMRNIAAGNNVQPGAGDRAAQQVAQATGDTGPSVDPLGAGGTQGPDSPGGGIQGLLAGLR